jgi:hypothetical protein
VTEIGGLWRLNVNGSQGVMGLVSRDNVNCAGTMSFDDTGLRQDPVDGSWDDQAGRLELVRHLPGGASQSFVGFLGDNQPPRLIIAGSFTESDVPEGSARSRFGWCAFSRFD